MVIDVHSEHGASWKYKSSSKFGCGFKNWCQMPIGGIRSQVEPLEMTINQWQVQAVTRGCYWVWLSPALLNHFTHFLCYYFYFVLLLFCYSVHV